MLGLIDTIAPRKLARRLLPGLAVSAVALAGAPAGAVAGDFTFLQTGFTQSVYGVGPEFFGGVAFANNGDPLVDFCQFGGSGLRRFDHLTTTTVNGSQIHPSTVESSSAGCGLTNHPDGTLYSNTSGGVVNLSASTGAQLRAPFGPAGNALGITPDPQSGDLVYNGSGGTVYDVNRAFTTVKTFSTALNGHFLDGIFFDPTGNYLFVSDRSPGFHLTILRRDGSLVQSIPMSDEPDGIAFHAAAPPFVVTDDTNGNMTRFDFPGGDFTKVPTLSMFASGGFRGDLSQVGADGCLYVSQAGTRYDNGVTGSTNSLARICGGFAAPPGVATRAGGFSCRASALRVSTALESSERVIANPPDNPCKKDQRLLDAEALPLSTVYAQQLEASTAILAGSLPAAGDNAQAESKVASVKVGALAGHAVAASVLNSTAKVACTAGAAGLTPTFSSSSSVAQLTVDSRTVPVDSSPLTISLAGHVVVYVNRTIMLGGVRTQRALEIDVNGLPAVVAGESKVDISGSPCSTIIVPGT